MGLEDRTKTTMKEYKEDKEGKIKIPIFQEILNSIILNNPQQLLLFLDFNDIQLQQRNCLIYSKFESKSI